MMDQSSPSETTSDLSNPSANTASTTLDLTDLFDAMVASKIYNSLEEFEESLMQFQRTTSTSFVKCWSFSARKWFEETGERLPVKHRSVSYRCIHGSSARPVGSRGRRVLDCNCRSTITIRFVDGTYLVTSWNMNHSHASLARSPWVYPLNRKLNKEQEKTILGLQHCFRSSKEFREFVSVTYGLQLSVDDLRHLKDRLKRIESSANKSEEPTAGSKSPDSEQILPKYTSKSPDIPSGSLDVTDRSPVLKDSISFASDEDTRNEAQHVAFEMINVLLNQDSSTFREAVDFIQMFIRLLSDSNSVPECLHVCMQHWPLIPNKHSVNLNCQFLNLRETSTSLDEGTAVESAAVGTADRSFVADSDLSILREALVSANPLKRRRS